MKHLLLREAFLTAWAPRGLKRSSLSLDSGILRSATSRTGARTRNSFARLLGTGSLVISEARRLFQAAAPLGVPGILVLTLGRQRPGSSERLELRMDMSGFEHVARKRLGGGLEAPI